jgi:hypothetical protein
LVFDPHTKTPQFIEDKDGAHIGEINPLDKYGNLTRDRQRPECFEEDTSATQLTSSVVESALERHNKRYILEN